jgi:hypothetical protein
MVRTAVGVTIQKREKNDEKPLLSALARGAGGATARVHRPRRPLMCLAARFLADSALMNVSVLSLPPVDDRHAGDRGSRLLTDTPARCGLEDRRNREPPPYWARPSSGGCRARPGGAPARKQVINGAGLTTAGSCICCAHRWSPTVTCLATLRSLGGRDQKTTSFWRHAMDNGFIKSGLQQFWVDYTRCRFSIGNRYGPGILFCCLSLRRLLALAGLESATATAIEKKKSARLRGVSSAPAAPF